MAIKSLGITMDSLPVKAARFGIISFIEGEGESEVQNLAAKGSAPVFLTLFKELGYCQNARSPFWKGADFSKRGKRLSFHQSNSLGGSVDRVAIFTAFKYLVVVK